MPLQASQATGLWENPVWDGTKPGTFALIIGVSKYDHLKGDEQSYELGQLGVSALTAHHFFSWMNEEYMHPDLPLAKVWLLLAPTDAEIQEIGDFPKDGFRSPTFANCENAIGEWYSAIQSLDSQVSEKSRAVFFFSGHGLEITLDKQILLPSDYLSPPIRNVNKALSTYNLYSGLRATPLPEVFFFLDACRNDNEKLKKSGVEGTRILNECLQPRPDAICPIVHATGPGSPAWAPSEPKEGISVFGQALLECLECTEGVKAWLNNNHYWITFRELEDYLSPRVASILEGEGFRIKQPVQISWAAGKTPICEVGPPRSITFGFASGDEKILADTIALPQLSPLALPQGPQGPVHSASIGAIHNLLHDEIVTSSLWKARLYDLERRQWTDLKHSRAEHSLRFREIASTEDCNTFQMEVELQRSSTQWFEVTLQNQTAACLLIGDKQYHPCYILRFDLSMAPSAGRLISGFDVSLANSSQGLLGEAATLWNHFRGSDILKEGKPAEFALLEEVLSGKRDSPLAATVAALLLLRAWRPDLLHDWLKNLTDWFPDRPDGWVIRVEQLLRTKQEEGLEEAITAFLELARLPLPFTSEGLGHASRQAGELLRFAFPAPEKQTVEQQRRHQALSKLQQRINKALAVFRPGGFSAVFVGSQEAVAPQLLLPTVSEGRQGLRLKSHL